MKISDQLLTETKKVAGGKDANAATKRKRVEGRGETGDRVSVSASPTQISEIRAQLDAVPDVRAEKVEQLRAAIGNGTYKPDASDIADAMMREAMFYEQRGVP